MNFKKKPVSKLSRTNTYVKKFFTSYITWTTTNSEKCSEEYNIKVLGYLHGNV